jgi:hypothetical protein
LLVTQFQFYCLINHHPIPWQELISRPLKFLHSLRQQFVSPHQGTNWARLQRYLGTNFSVGMNIHLKKWPLFIYRKKIKTLLFKKDHVISRVLSVLVKCKKI